MPGRKNVKLVRHSTLSMNEPKMPRETECHGDILTGLLGEEVTMFNPGEDNEKRESDKAGISRSQGAARTRTTSMFTSLGTPLRHTFGPFASYSHQSAANYVHTRPPLASPGAESPAVSPHTADGTFPHVVLVVVADGTLAFACPMAGKPWHLRDTAGLVFG